MRMMRLTLWPALALLGSLAVASAEDATAPLDLHPAKPAKAAAKSAAKPDKQDKSADVPILSDAEAVQNANDWFDSSTTMTADFVQIAPDGKRSEGKLYVQRPGKLRFQFAPPNPLEIVADGRSVAVRDQKLQTQDLYLISQTPLKFLLSDRIDLAKDTKVLRVNANEKAVSILIEDKATLGGSAQIDLIFDPATFMLKQWAVTDAQGFQTVVSLFNVDLAAKPDPALFKIDETAMTTSKRR
jgi:outer membrane lipoprotein-sorting protein